MTMLMRRLGFWNVFLAAAVAVALIIEAEVRAKGSLSPGAFALAVVAAAPLAWRTRAPLAALVCVGIGALAFAALFHAGLIATAMVAIELYTVALLGDRHRSLVVGAITTVVVIVAIALIAGTAADVLIRAPLVFASLAVGDTVRSRRALRAAAEERAEREEREREEEGRRHAVEERLRIARELHDTLAHSLVAINVRASVVLDLDASQDPSGALRDVKETSATALRDLRATLSLLRDQDDAAPTAPAFDLEGLPGLADRARCAGLQADVDVQVDGAVVPSAIGRAAFRIVQEAMTNVLRHAEASSAHIGVRKSGDALDIEITDDGKSNSAGVRPGLGLRGMAERAAALGGHVDVGPRDGGGWRVHAVLPLGGGGR
jgi:signal transduction histidine kinase